MNNIYALSVNYSHLRFSRMCVSASATKKVHQKSVWMLQNTLNRRECEMRNCLDDDAQILYVMF